MHTLHSYLKCDDACVVVVQRGEDVVGIGAERGWNWGGIELKKWSTFIDKNKQLYRQQSSYIYSLRTQKQARY